MKLIKQPPDFYFFFFSSSSKLCIWVVLGIVSSCFLMLLQSVCFAAHKGIISCSFLLKSSAGEKDNSASSVNRLRTFSIKRYLAACWAELEELDNFKLFSNQLLSVVSLSRISCPVLSSQVSVSTGNGNFGEELKMVSPLEKLYIYGILLSFSINGIYYTLLLHQA